MEGNGGGVMTNLKNFQNWLERQEKKAAFFELFTRSGGKCLIVSSPDTPEWKNRLNPIFRDYNAFAVEKPEGVSDYVNLHCLPLNGDNDSFVRLLVALKKLQVSYEGKYYGE